MPRRCETCGEWIWQSDPSPHVCPPKFSWFDLENDPDMEEPRPVYASDAERAAEKAVDVILWEGDAPGPDTDIPIAVRDEDGIVTHWVGHYTLEPSIQVKPRKDEETESGAGSPADAPDDTRVIGRLTDAAAAIVESVDRGRREGRDDGE